MGCTASRPNGELSSTLQHPLPPPPSAHDQYQWLPHHHHHSPSLSISIPAPGPPSFHDFDIVPLSSTVYGVHMNFPAQQDHLLLSNPSQSPASPAGYRLHGTAAGPTPNVDDSMKHMLQLLDSLDMGEPAPAPLKLKRGAHISSILEDLKPGLEKHLNEALGKPYVAEFAIKPAAAVDYQIASYGGLRKGKENKERDDDEPKPVSKASEITSPAYTKPLKSKPSFASRFLKRSFSSLRSSKKGGDAGQAASTAAVEAPRNLVEVPPASGSSLFDADFLSSYADAVKELTQEDWNQMKQSETSQSPGGAGGAVCAPVETQPPATMVTTKRVDPFQKFDRLCPPGGDNTVVLYTTSLRGIRKTFEDCNNVRSILQSLRVRVDERDVAMHQVFRNELREMMGNKPGPVPRLFIKGHHIGGAEEVLELHEEEELAPLLEGLPQDWHGGAGHLCDGCGGARFVPCLECSGSCKVVHPDNPREVIRCPDCNENGLIQCPICN